MQATKILKAILTKNAATYTQMNSMDESETAGSPTQSTFAAMMAKKPGATANPTPTAPPASPAAPTPALAKTLPKPGVPVGQHVPNTK